MASIVTKRGDKGETDLLFGARVLKSNPTVLVLGAFDEFTASLGVCRCELRKISVCGVNPKKVRDAAGVCLVLFGNLQLESIQMMGLVACPEDKGPKFFQGFPSANETILGQVEVVIWEFEPKLEKPQRGWAISGKTELGARLDVARAVCRRLESLLVGAAPLLDGGTQYRREYSRILVIVNRVSDLLWVCSRYFDQSLDC